MTRTITMDEHGEFSVSDDPAGVIAGALLVAVSNRNATRVATGLAPDGDGLDAPTFGAIYRATSREDLPPPFDHDPSLDPETQELWVLVRDRSQMHPTPGRFMMRGDELRELVSRALALRGR